MYVLLNEHTFSTHTTSTVSLSLIFTSIFKTCMNCLQVMTATELERLYRKVQDFLVDI
jgi:hypothetical protein